MRWMLKGPKGEKDPVLTITVWTVLVVLLRVLFGGLSIAIKGKTFTATPFDAGIVAALLTPTLSFYAAHHYTKTRFGSNEPTQDPLSGEKNK